jgi:SSS family solute:Na+ symporter
MGNLLTPVDLGIFFTSLLAVMLLGLWAGRKEDTSSDYYLAGRSTRWWGVAGSIFGSNVSANHLVGMMGVGFSVGFAQSHFEISAIAGLLMLCYGFLPMYRKLNVYTLSEYLSRRYDDLSRVAYAAIMLIIIVVIQMVPGFYIGSRSLNILLKDGETATATVVVNDDGSIDRIDLGTSGDGYVATPEVEVVSPKKGTGKSAKDIGSGGTAEVTMADGRIESIALLTPGSGYVAATPPTIRFVGGAKFDESLSPGDVDPKMFVLGILLMAVVTGTYTIVGGLKAVIFTDVIQSVLLLIAGIILSFIVFSQPEVGGWAGMVAQDAAETGQGKMHLYKSSADPKLPWTGVLTGLMVLHFYYWGANQFIVQRALAGRSDRETRFGIIVAGFFKLLIPFFSIAAGTAAYYYFTKRGDVVAPDAVFITLLGKLVAPIGFGLVGLIAAGMIGAILSSLDSMMNSAATIVTFDIYKRYVNPKATEKQLIKMGRYCILAALIGGAGLTIVTADPNSEGNFFLTIATHQSKLVAGVVVAFLLGMFWQRATAAGSIVSMIVGVVASYGLPFVYKEHLADVPQVVAVFGTELNFMHSVFLAACLAFVAHVGVSFLTPANAEKGQLTWLGQGLATPQGLIGFCLGLIATIVLCALLALSMIYLDLYPPVAAVIAGGWTWAGFAWGLRPRGKGEEIALLKSDTFWAGLLAGLAVFMMFYFY